MCSFVFELKKALGFYSILLLRLGGLFMNNKNCFKVTISIIIVLSMIKGFFL